jgi:uncharacterized protein (TIGR02246 family)
MRFIAMLFATIALCACQTMRSSGDDKAAIASVSREWTEALNRCDLAAIAQLYAPDAVLWGTTSQTLISTPDGVRQYFERVCQPPSPPKVAFSEQLIRVHGDAATNSGSYTFTVMRDGKPVVVPARYTLAYRRIGGRWLIVDHHSSIRPAPPR